MLLQKAKSKQKFRLSTIQKRLLKYSEETLHQSTHWPTHSVDPGPRGMYLTAGNKGIGASGRTRDVDIHQCP